MPTSILKAQFVQFRLVVRNGVELDPARKQKIVRSLLLMIPRLLNCTSRLMTRVEEIEKQNNMEKRGNSSLKTRVLLMTRTLGGCLQDISLFAESSF